MRQERIPIHPKITVIIILGVLACSSIPGAATIPVRKDLIHSDGLKDYQEEKKKIRDAPDNNPRNNLYRTQENPFTGLLNRAGRENGQSPSLEIRLKAATFDPLMERPGIPYDLSYQQDNGYYLVQCTGPIQPDWLGALENAGAIILGYVPEYTYLVHMDGGAKPMILGLRFVRWVGLYHPAYKIQEGLLDMQGQVELNVVVFRDNVHNLQNVRRELASLGGIITYGGEEDNIIRVRIDSSAIRDMAFIPEVEWLDLYTPPIAFMDNVRVFTGAEGLHNIGLNGTGIVGEVKDNGCDLDHPDFEGQVIGTDGNPVDDAHGTCTFGIVFGTGANDAQAEGMMPGGKGVFSDWGVGRGTSIANLVNNWGGLFQSNSWSSGTLDSTYTSYSQADDQAVFDYDVLMLYAAGNSNQGVYPGSLSQDSVAKNVMCVGAVNHWDDTNKSNDRWTNWGAGATPSQGPVADGRIKPDIAGVFDAIYTTDSVDGDGENGYATGNYYSDFGGTSGATPIVAGASGLIYQMYVENHFGNNPSGTIPHAATIKAILIADAYQYDFSQAERYQQGWGLVDVDNVYNIGKNHFIVDGDVSLETGDSISYSLSPTTSDPLKITLVWTDVPGTTSSSQHLINDLDLKVTDPNNDVYYGNYDLVNSLWSSPGGTPDNLNNVENVFIENPMAGEWTVEISAPNIALDGDTDTPETDQHFALVASNVLQAERDLGVSDLDIPTYAAPSQPITVNATIFNNGLSNETDVLVNLTVDGVVEDDLIIPQIDLGTTVPVNFVWTPPTGIYLVGVQVETVPFENLTANNWREGRVIVQPDLAVTGIDAPKYLVPDENARFNATLQNLGKVDEYNVHIRLYINGSLEDSVIVPSSPAESSQQVTLEWKPTLEGWFKIEAYAPPVIDEDMVENNRFNISLLATSKPLVSVAVLDSYGTDYSDDAPWDYLNDNWMNFGTTPVNIDYTTLNKDDITYGDLTAKNADVLIIACAFSWEFTDAEINAISQYVQEGHGFIVTSATMYWNVPNNNKFAPLFGMRDDLSYTADYGPELDLIDTSHPLFQGVPDPYTTGSSVTVMPSDSTWDPDDLTEGTYIALSTDDSGAIVVNKGLVYITYWIGYSSNLDDVQLYYNAMRWSKFEHGSHDMAAVGIEHPVWVFPDQDTFVNATVVNAGLGKEYGIIVNFTVDAILITQKVIPELDPGKSQKVSYSWTSPSQEGSYLVEIEIAPLLDEDSLYNNRVNASVIVTTGPTSERIALISDNMELNSVTGAFDDVGKPYDVLNFNVFSGYTSNITLLLQYQMVLFYNNDRTITALEQKTLGDYLLIGGGLVVTGYDSLGDPDDSRLAKVVRSSTYGNDQGEGMFTVTNGLHPITNGIYGQFSAGTQFTVSETDHDRVQGDVANGTVVVAELWDGYDKIIATEFANGGKVVYWNGNRDCSDWLSLELQPIFKNLITWIVPIHDDVGVISLSHPQQGFTGEPVTIDAELQNFGLNDQTDVGATMYVRNSYGHIIHSDTHTGIAIDSGDIIFSSWQWTPAMSDLYTIGVGVLFPADEVAVNNLRTGQITIYNRFFEDDMESGQGDWESTASSLIRPPLWHLTTTDSHTPTTSWWCGEDTTDQYSIWADQYLVSPVIDLTEAKSAYLHFYHMYSIDDFPLLPDWGYVEITSNGADWAILDSYQGTWLSWDDVTLNISSYKGDQIQVRFNLVSGVLLTDNGWWVDDFEVYGTGNIYSIDVDVAVDKIAVGRDESAVFDIVVANRGNAEGIVEMGLSGTGMEDWAVSFAPQIFSLEPGMSVNTIMTVTPSNSEFGDYTGQVTARLRDGGIFKTSDSVDVTVTVEQWFDVVLSVQNNQLDLEPGANGDFIITVMNLGNGPDTFTMTTEDFVSGSSTGWQYQLDAASVALDAFQSDVITLSVTAPDDAYPDDSIAINVVATSLGDAGESALVVTTTTATEFHLIQLHTASSREDTEPGLPAGYTITVQNLGNTQVSVSLDVINPEAGSDGWSHVLATKTLSVGPYSEADVSLTATPPDNEIAFTQKAVNVSATTQYSSDLLTITTSVLLVGDFVLDTEQTALKGMNTEDVTYIISITNTQNHEDVSDITVNSAEGWTVRLYDADGTTPLSDSDSDGKTDTGTLAPLNGIGHVTVAVEIPENAEAHSKDDTTVTFSSSLPDGHSHSLVLTTEVELSGSYTLSAEKYSQSDVPGRTLTYLVTLENSLNYEMTVDLAVASREKWEVALYDESGMGPLSDSNGNGRDDSGLLSAFSGTFSFLVHVIVPDTAIAYTDDLVTVTASPSLPGVPTSSIHLNATVERIYDVEIEQEAGELTVAQGKTLIYTIMLTNRGNHEETLDVRFTELPEGWRADFSQSEPAVSMGGSKVIAVNIDIPKDTEPGNYLVTISGTSQDGEPAGELDLTIEVEKAEEPSEIPWLLILLILLAVSIIIIVLFVKSRGGAYQLFEPGPVYYEEAIEPIEVAAVMEPLRPAPLLPPPAAEPEPMDMLSSFFPPIELVNCPNCYFDFEVEVEEWPMRVTCPRCGMSGTLL